MIAVCLLKVYVLECVLVIILLHSCFSLLSSLFLQLLVGKCIVVRPHFRLSVVAKSPSYVLEIPRKMILRVKSV